MSPVAVIVPIAGINPSYEPSVRSLLNQDYENYNVFFIAQDQDDPAFTLIMELVGESDGVTVSCAGRATRCGQKNFNLLHGVTLAAKDSDIYIFCDAGHIAPSDWITKLISPLLYQNNKVVSSGYHYMSPDEPALVSTGWSLCVLGMSMVKRISWCTQPWGGATGIWKRDFDALKVDSLWRETVVDDVTLAELLQKEKVPVHAVTDADLRTKLDKPTFRSWTIWLIRQWSYLKFVFPVQWFCLGLGGIIFTLLVFLCHILVGCYSFGIVSSAVAVPVSVLLTLFLAATFFLRSFHPVPSKLRFYYPALMITLVVAGWCHACTWFSPYITWAKIRYKVGKRGKVVEMIRQ